MKKFDTIVESILNEDNISKVIKLLKKEKVDADEVSPNFVANFADENKIKLTADEIVKISDTF